MTLKIQTLGTFHIEVDGEDITTQCDPTRTFLLIYLLDSGRPQARAHLGELLWPDRPPGRARANLRTLLTRLRPLFADFLQIDQSWLALQPANDIWFDAHEFATFITNAEQCSLHEPARTKALTEAMALYQGDFLADIISPTGEILESWLMTRRLQYHGQAVQAIRELLQSNHGSIGTRTRWARQLLTLEPLDEQACSTLMQLLATQNQRDEALWHFQRYQRELTEIWSSATPSEKLVMLAAKIRLGMDIRTGATLSSEESTTDHAIAIVSEKLPHTDTAFPVVSVTDTPPSIPSPDPAEAAAQIVAFQQFPAPVKPLIGRKQERGRLLQWLNLGYRLISITGLGGIGKSHFTQTVLAEETERWRHGGIYVTISETVTGAKTDQGTDRQNEQRRAVQILCRTIAMALDLPLPNGQEYTEHLAQILARHECCLVLDNFELLLPAASYLQTLLAKAGKLTIIVISRRRLMLTAEANIALDGLPRQHPNTNEGGSVAAFDIGTAEELLYLNLIRHRPNFRLHEKERSLLHIICQAVRGMPLALEMVPGLTRRMALQEIATLLHTDPLTLTADFADTTEQQRSLYTLMDTMFVAATPPIQTALVRLTVFATPFTAAMARCVVNSKEWAELREQRWLETADELHFSLHPLIAAFLRSLRAEQQWARIYADARRAHAAYYADFLANQPFFKNLHSTETITWLHQNFAEVTNACQTLLEETPEDAADLLHLITIYGQYFGDLSTVRHWLEYGLAALPQTHPVRFRLLLDYLTCTSQQYDPIATEIAVAEAHALMHTQGDQAALLELYIRLGWVAHRDTAATTPAVRQEGWRYFSQALELAEAMENQQQIADILAQRAFVASWDPAGYAQAQADCQRALAIAHQLGQPSLLATIYKFYAYVEFAAGHFPMAQRFNERARQLLGTETGPAVIRGWLCTEHSQMALAQREIAVAKEFLHQAESIFRAADDEVGLIQYNLLRGIVALLEEEMALAEHHWLLAYRSAYNLEQWDKLVIPLMLGIGLTQLLQGDPILGAQLVAVARTQYETKSFHWVPPEQQLMNDLIERATAETAALALPSMPLDGQMARQALRLMADLLAD